MPKANQGQKVPDYCGFQCPHSEFPPADSAGICRTMAAVYCKKLRRLVDKNRPCRWQGGRRQAKPSSSSSSRFTRPRS